MRNSHGHTQTIYLDQNNEIYLCLSKPSGVEHSYGVAAVPKCLQFKYTVLGINEK